MKIGDFLKNTLMSFKENDEYDDDLDENEETEDEDVDINEDDEEEEELAPFSLTSAPKKSVFGGYNNKSRNVLPFDNSSASKEKSNMKANAIILTDIQEAKEAAMELMNGTMLIVKFDDDKEIATRLFHFMIGVTYAIDAKFCRTKDNSYIFYPRSASIDGNNIADELEEHSSSNLDL